MHEDEIALEICKCVSRYRAEIVGCALQCGVQAAQACKDVPY